MMIQRYVILSSLCLATCVARATPPTDWPDDPANSQWIVFDGTADAQASNGLTMLPDSVEGNLATTNLAGVTCAQSRHADGTPGYWYVKATPWDAFKTWLGTNDVLLTARYFDGGPGTFTVSYDSSDPSVRFDPYPAGVWRKPDAIPQGQPLTGDRTWKTLSVRLPLAYFTKRLHGADIRLDGHAQDFALAGIAITRVPKASEPPIVMKQELRVARATGLTTFNTGARFAGAFAQAGNASIVVEAELASEIIPQQGSGTVSESQASGGGAIQYVGSASYDITVTTPGRYTVWQRGAFPLQGGWNHAEWVDGVQHEVQDGAQGPENGWVWIRAGAYDLKAGPHTFKLNYCGGAKLDVIVFSLADTPPDVATLASSYRGPTAGEVWTVPVKPFDVAQWRGVQFRLPETVEARYEYSADDGKTWTAFDPSGDLTKLAIRGGGQDSLQFHVIAKNRDGKHPFLFGGGMLRYQAGPHNTRHVANARLDMEFDAYGIRSIRDPRTGLAVAQAAPMHASLVSLTMKKPGDATPFTCDLYNAALEQFDVGGTAETPVVTMAHRLDNGLRITTTGTLLPNGQSEWRLDIDNPTEFEVAEFRFPVVTGIELGGNPTDDWLFVPRCWGQVMRNVAGGGKLGDKKILRDHEADDTADVGRLLDTGAATPMRWAALWDTQQGFYLGIEDPRYEDYCFYYGGDSSGGATLASWQRTLVKPRSQWRSGTFRVALTGGDWHEAADIYRDYVARTLKPNDVHPYVKWMVDAWSVMPADQASFLGWDMLHSGGETLMTAWRQMTDGVDAGYCGLYPYPALAWGTTREFSQRLAVRRALGGFFTDYHNFHLWSPGYGYRPRVVTFPKSRLPADAMMPDDTWYQRASAYTYNGAYTRFDSNFSLYFEAPMAMASREWRAWLTDWTFRDIAFGTDGRYYDQLNTMYENGRLYPDFDTYGCWMPATLDVLTKIRQAVRVKNPYFTSSGEICNDVYGQKLDMHMTSGVWNRDEFFKYCLPHQIMIDGGSNGGLGDSFGGQDRFRFVWQVGARFDSEPNDPQLLALRRETKSLLYDATFRDTVGVTVRDSAGAPLEPVYQYSGKWQNAPVKGTSARWFLANQAGQRGAIVNFINAPIQKGATCSLRTTEFGPVASAFAITADGIWRPVVGRQEGDTYTFPIPETECASVVLAGKLAPLVKWTIDPAAAPGVVRKLTLTLTNPNAEPLTGTATFRLPGRWKTPPVVTFGPIPSGKAQTFAMPVAVPGNARKGRTDLWCDIVTPSGTFSAYALLVVNDPVVADFRGNPGSYHVWLRNLTTEPLTGTLTVAARAGLKVSAPTTVALPPEAELQVPVTVIGQDQLREISEMSATVTIGRQSTEVVRGVIPTVPNGDFETDEVGDHKPDWWMCRKGGDAFGYESISLAEGAHSGKHCLQLDPAQAGEKFTCAFPVHSVLKTDTRYRLSVWIKTASTNGVYINAGAVNGIGAGQTTPEWKQFSAEFKTGPTPSGLYRALYNTSSAPAYFDDLKIEELGTP